MNVIWENLSAAFFDDHRKLLGGYRALIDALQARDIAGIVEAAERLDALAGAHVEFEERFLYPEVEISRGDAYTSKLYEEHEEVLKAIAQMRSLDGDSDPSDREIAEWIGRIQDGLQHAKACGSLLSFVHHLGPRQQQTYLNGLIRWRREGRRWSELHPLETLRVE